MHQYKFVLVTIHECVSCGLFVFLLETILIFLMLYSLLSYFSSLSYKSTESGCILTESIRISSFSIVKVWNLPIATHVRSKALTRPSVHSVVVLEERSSHAIDVGGLPICHQTAGSRTQNAMLVARKDTYVAPVCRSKPKPQA